jgi:sugar phosphate isomerase/epimerase
MAAISRRTFFGKAGREVMLIGMVASSVARIKANPLGLPIGSQTWPHRVMIKNGDFRELLTILSRIGVQGVEMCSPYGYEDFAGLTDGKQVKMMLADHGLVCESGHFGMDELRTKQSQSIAWAKDVGIKQMITATLDAGDKPTMDDVKKAADEYNRIAAVAARAGIQQGLHNEGFELSEVGGRRTYDVLFELLDPSLVKFQFQMSTISRGFVAAEYFVKYPGRFISMHVQDVDLNATPPSGQTGDDGPASRGVQVPVGKGSIDWVKTFQAAKVGGVKNYFVEQNMAFTTESVAFLKRLTV